MFGMLKCLGVLRVPEEVQEGEMTAYTIQTRLSILFFSYFPISVYIYIYVEFFFYRRQLLFTQKLIFT